MFSVSAVVRSGLPDSRPVERARLVDGVRGGSVTVELGEQSFLQDEHLKTMWSLVSPHSIL